MSINRLKFKTLHSVNNPNSIHGLYPYRGKISAIDAMELVKQLPSEGVLLDPFCGSGTILYEALKIGLKVIGVDNNPIAIQIARAKLSSIKIDETIRKTENLIYNKNGDKIDKMPRQAIRYFHEETAEQIMYLKQFYKEFNDYEKGVFLGAICLAARGCNDYRWSSTQIGKMLDKKRKIDFFEKFLNKLKKHAAPIRSKNFKIVEGDSRELSKFIKGKSINYVYTSPPYFDALDYTSNYTRIIHQIFENDTKEIKKGLIQKFDSYEHDMKQCFGEIKKVTTDDALIIFIVGDKKFGNKVINGGDFFREIITEKPSYIIQRRYTGTASKIWDKINRTNRSEQIIVWDKSKW